MQNYEIEIKKIGINGEGIGYIDKKIVFVPGALPNEKVKVKALHEQDKFIQAKLLKIVSPSPNRIKPPCPVYDSCGGCQLQHLSYKKQRQAKVNILREAFTKYTKKSPKVILPMIGLPYPWDYRNKAQFQVEYTHGKVKLGLYTSSSHQLVDLKSCMVQHPKLNETLRELKEILIDVIVPEIKSVVLRISETLDIMQLTLITNTTHLPKEERLIESINLYCPEIVQISHNYQPNQKSLVFGPITTTIWEAQPFYMKLEKLRFLLSPRSFFQLNDVQTIHLYQTIAQMAKFSKEDIVLDAHAGVGTISCWISKAVKKIYAVENIKEAVKNGQHNAHINQCNNITFIESNVENWLHKQIKSGLYLDKVILDPPRSGCDPLLLQSLVQMSPKKIIYASCNPSTLAKDCKVFIDHGYQILKVQPIDMFPQTSHVESVVLLEKV